MKDLNEFIINFEYPQIFEEMKDLKIPKEFDKVKKIKISKKFNDEKYYDYSKDFNDTKEFDWSKDSNDEKIQNFDSLDNSKNNGGSTDYYDFPENAKCVMDLIEIFGMNFSQGNILKSAYCLNRGRHDGTNMERELNKIIFFAKRELERISNIHKSSFENLKNLDI
jgi:hypothetical protein